MTEYAKLVISVDSKQVSSADKGLKTLSSSAGKAEKTTNQLTSAFKKLAGPIATYLSVREISRAAESYTNLTNRLRLVTGSSEELARAQADLFRIAQSSRQPLSETAELYQRIATNQDQLGLTSAGVARITETINKSLAVSGTSAASAAGALTQLGQAFASGQLRGEELNSVLENAPALAGALAEGLGVTVGQLRELGKEGKLTAQNVVDALLDQSNAIDSAFSTIAPTVSSAFTTVGNSFTQLIGKMDETSETSAGAAEQIMKLADILSDPATIKAAQAMAAGIATAFGAVVTGATEMVSFVQWAAEEAAAFMNGIASDDVVRLQQEIQRVEDLKNSSFLDRTILFGRDGLIEYYNDAELDAELGKLRSALDDALKGSAINLPPKTNAPATETPSFTKPGGFTPTSSSSGRGGISAAEREAQKILQLYARTEESLNRQIALYGNASDAAALRYDIESGSLRDLSSQQKQRLVLLQDEIDARNSIKEIQNINLELLQATGQEQAARNLQFELEYAEKIAEYERQGNVEALQRLQTLKQIRDVNGRSSGFDGLSDAPRVTGLDASVGGATSEIARLDEEANALEEWRSKELERQLAFLEAKAINEEDYNARITEINRRTMEGLAAIEESKNTAILQSSGEFFGNMAVLSQSGNKKLGAVGKAAAIAQATISGFTAIQNALAVPPYPVGLALAVSAGVVTAANIASIAGVGFRQGGYTGSGGVDDVAGVVHGKEFVFDAGATARIGVQNLEAMRKGQPAANAPVMTHAAAAPSRGPMSITNNFTLQERTDNRTQQQIAIKAGQSQRQAQARLGG